MGVSALSERDLAVLRSFAERIDPSDAGAHNNLGVLYFQKGLIPEAIEAFSRALELDPKMQVAQDNLEKAYSTTGYYDQVVTELREKLRHDPDDHGARLALGRAYAALGHYPDAIGQFETLLARNPNEVSVIIQLGLAEKARGGMDRACDWFERARRLEPDSSVARFYYGEALYNRGLNEPALEELKESVRLNPDNADAHYLIAFVHGDMGNHDEARAATKRAVKLNPTLARAQANLTLDDSVDKSAAQEDSRPQIAEGRALAHYNLGLAFRQKGYYVEALREYRLGLDADEDRRLILEAMAEVDLIRRDFEAALRLYDSLVEEFPDSPKLWNERGVCLQQSGRRDEADESYHRAISIDPGYALAWNNLGVLRSHLPDHGKAQEAFEKAVRNAGTVVAPRLNLALLLFQHRKFQPALEAYKQSLARHPNHPVAWNGVGLVLMELKRYQDARNAFARAVDSDPDYAPARYNLSFTLSQLGDFDGALRETKRALELEPFYVPQKFALSIDLQYEDPTIAVVPELSADVTTDELGSAFSLEEGVLDDIFSQLVEQPEQAAPAEDPEAPFGLVKDYISKGLLERATAELNRAVARGGSASLAGVLGGDIFMKRGLYGEALERYRAAKQDSPENPSAWRGEIRALLALDRQDEASRLAPELARMAGRDAESLVACAQVRLAEGQPVPALDLLRRAQELDPGRSDLLRLQAQIARKLGNLDDALDAYQAALQLDSGQVQVWHELGELEEARHNAIGARLAYERALNLLPTYSAAALSLARLLLREESSGAALNLLIELLTFDPYDFDALVLLGEILLGQGRVEQGEQAFDRVLRFVADHVEAIFLKGKARARRRDFAAATRLWSRVIELAPAGPFAGKARAALRSARDLAHIFAGETG